MSNEVILKKKINGKIIDVWKYPKTERMSRVSSIIGDCEITDA